MKGGASSAFCSRKACLDGREKRGGGGGGEGGDALYRWIKAALYSPCILERGVAEGLQDRKFCS